MINSTRQEMQQTQKLSQSMQTAIRLLSMDLDELSNEIQKSIAENPALEYVPPQRSLHEYAMQIKTRFSGSPAGVIDAEREIPAETTLRSVLEQQIRLSGQSDEIVKAAIIILYQLTPRGYFAQDLDEFAAENGFSPEVAQAALDTVQALEPTGIGARTQAECLELQLRSREGVDPLCYDLVRLYLLEIGKGNLKQIARETGATLGHLRTCVEVIRSLNPIPCSLRGETVQYILPEFSVEVDSDNTLTIQFYNDYYPSLRKDATFLKLSQTLPSEEKDYVRRTLASADQLLCAIKLRQSTMEKLAQIIVKEQSAFFLGIHNLVPLRIEDVAREIGVHETTVYRAVQSKYLHCSRGTFPLSHFFQRELTGGSSAAAVKDIIRRLCASQEKMSDREISEALEKQGISVSRRTVAKYRSQMEIDSSFRRGAEVKEQS